MQDIKLTEADFDKKSIRDSYLGTSFSPDKRADDEIAGHIRWFNGTVDDLAGLCSNDEQRAYLSEQLPRFRAKYLEHASACTAAHSRCISTMIAGGSKFPVRRAEKANASYMRRVNESLEWQRKVIAAIRRGISNAGKAKETPGGPVAENTTTTVGDVEIIRNYELSRVQIIFSDKPEPDVIAQLKAHGWRWSPKNCAWQRQNTSNAYLSAVEIAGM